MSRQCFPRRPGLRVLACGLALAAGPGAARAQEVATASSFVENFDRLDTSFWYVSDGWNNGPHQNCTWSKTQARVENGALQLDFTAGKAGERDYACGEIQTRARYGHE